MTLLPENDRSRAEKAFLGVECSVSGRIWLARPCDSRQALAIAQAHDLPDILGRVLAARGVLIDEVPDYLNPTLRRLIPPPALVRDLEKGAERLARAVREGEDVGVIGDYDVDGTSATAMLVEFLQAAGINPRVHIPHRIEEGYGPSKAAVDAFAETGVRLLLTLDCGAMAHDVLAHAAARGLETIVVDHHQMGTALPPAHAVINPNRADDDSGLGHLCAAGLTFLLVALTARLLEKEGHWQTLGRMAPDPLQWLDLVALATVCDVVPLKGLNRAYVRQGLRVMAKRARKGLAALADCARLQHAPDVHALGFVLGPRINAAGRIGHAHLALQLLTTRRQDEAQSLSFQLERLNRERQELEAAIVEEAVIQAEKSLAESGRRHPLVVAGEDWHPGVIGLVAARLKERFALPAVAFSIDDQGQATGSARSVEGVDIGRAVALAVAEGILERGGGHAMAAGMACAAERIADFRAFLDQALSADLAQLPEQPPLFVDGALTAGAASADLVRLLDSAGPYGAGNPRPVFVLPAHRVEWADVVGERHVRCTLRAADGTRLKAIAFRAVGTPLGDALLNADHRPMHVAGRLALDGWNGANAAQLLITDAAPVG